MEASKLILDTFPFLNSMDKRLYKEMIETLSFIKIKRGKVLVEDDGRCAGVPMVLKGKIRLYKLSSEGREITLFNLNKGDICFLAAACIIGELEYGFIVEAITDGEIAMIPAEYFLSLFHNSTTWQKKIFEVMATRLIETMNVVEAVTFTSIEKRVGNYLYNKYKEGKHCVIYSTHDSIAKEIGTAREVVSRQLKDLENQSVVSLGRGRITILDQKKLKKFLGL